MLKHIQHTNILVMSILVVASFFSCSKSPKCWGNNKNKGIIESSTQIDCEPKSEQQNFIIKDDSTYKQIFTNPTTGQLECAPQPIDFNSYTILGQFAAGACEVKYIREVSRNNNEKNYHYKVIVKSCGTCLKESYSFNWVTVPKLPDGWTVTFEIEEK